ncbi:ubiquitin-like domain-containing protein [Siminovitchia sp. FSL H7-0308]|uniref:ubiquitin-like domain-containing protein n=1 Tax=unclassified Siminovitchia TaxID=2837530 RepID=UPI0030D13682
MASFMQMEKRKKMGLAVASFLVFTATLITLINEGTKKTVALTLDGEKVVVKTHADTIQDMLNELNIDIKESDYLSHHPETALIDELSLVWEPAKKVEITDGSNSQVVWTTAKTVKQLLEENQIELKEQDQVNMSLTAPVVAGMDIQIERAFPLVLNDGGNVKEVWTTSTTVADFVKQQGITFGPLDKVQPRLEENISPNSEVHIIRGQKVTDVVEEPIDFEVITQKDPSLPNGTEKVIQEGKQGLVKKEYEVTVENGKEVNRTLISEKKIRESVQKVVAVGTGTKQSTPPPQITKQNTKEKTPQIIQTVEKDSGGKEIYVSATAYTATCNGCSGVTATGIDLKANPSAKVIAVDPNVIPLGTKVWVEGYGYAVAGDTGGAIKGNKIDVHVQTSGEAHSFGSKKVKVKILD